jgi:YVTN family beta-propeller protein
MRVQVNGMTGRTAYISNLMSGTVSVIDLEGRQLVRNIRVGVNPVFSIVYPPDPGKVLVTLHNYDRIEGEGRLVLVDPGKSRILQNIPYRGESMPSGMAYDEKSDLLYVADENLHLVHCHDGKSLKLISSLPAGQAPVHMDISGNGRYLVATNRLSRDLSVFHLDTTGGIETGITFPLTPNTGESCHPYDIWFTGRAGKCSVTDLDAGELLMVDVEKRKVTARIRLGDGSFGFTMDKAGKRAYVCNMGSGSVSVVDLVKKKVTGEMTGFVSPSHCAIDEKGQLLVVTDQGNTRIGKIPGVHLVDLSSGETIETIRDPLIMNPIGVTTTE